MAEVSFWLVLQGLFLLFVGIVMALSTRKMNRGLRELPGQTPMRYQPEGALVVVGLALVGWGLW